MELFEVHDCSILNTFYQHKMIHQFTRQNFARDLKSQIDFIIMKQQRCSRVCDVRAYRDGSCGSDHNHVVCKLIGIPRSQRDKAEHVANETQPEPRYKIWGLKKESIRTIYENRITYHHRTSPIGFNPECEYNTIKRSNHSAAMETVGSVEKKNRKEWINTEVERKCKEKQEAFNRWIQTRDSDHHIARGAKRRQTRR